MVQISYSPQPEPDAPTSRVLRRIGCGDKAGALSSVPLGSGAGGLWGQSWTGDRRRLTDNRGHWLGFWGQSWSFILRSIKASLRVFVGVSRRDELEVEFPVGFVSRFLEELAEGVENLLVEDHFDPLPFFGVHAEHGLT